MAAIREQILRRKPTAILLAEAGPDAEGLKRALGALDLTLLGIGAIVGAGIFVLTGVAAAKYAGPAIMMSFVVAGFACAMAALCYAEFAAMIPIAGSAYSYSYATMGELVGWIIGWDLVLEYAVGAAAVAVGWSGYLNVILRGMGIHLPEALTHAPAVGGIVDLPALLIVLLISAVLYIGISESARLNSVIVVIKLCAIAVVIIGGLFFVRPANWSPFAPFGWSGVMKGAAVIFFAYIGFDAVSTAAEEVIDPKRDLPIGILASLFVCTALYILVSAVLTGMVPAHMIDLKAPLASAFVIRGLNIIAWIVSAGAVAGLSSVLLVLLLGQSRIFFAISRDGLLPPAFSRIHPRFRTPYIPTTLTGIAVGLTAAFLPIQEIAELTNIGTLFAFVLVCLGVWILRRAEPEVKRPFHTPLVPLVPILGVVCCLFLMASLPVVTWLRFFIWMVAGLIIYFTYGRFHSRVSFGSETESSSGASMGSGTAMRRGSGSA
ncbi:MAG TPA: amino acid permease [Candidatus Binataceae bacterium]|nr:amino acid permease [Candidatus Binataceae bacterium]